MTMPNDTQHEQVSILGPSLRFKGELHAEEDLVIHGRIEGTIKHTQRLTICRDGHVIADIHGHVIAIEGYVEGDLEASTSVAIMESGKLKGDVQAPSVSIVDGASVNGSVTMTGSDRSLHTRRSTDKRSGSPVETSHAKVTSSR